MSDHDRLDSFAREAGRHVTAPDFNLLVSTSKRRRRAAFVASGCVLVAVAGVVAVGLQSVASDQTGPVHPGPTLTSTGPVPSPSPHTPSAQDRRAKQIVQNSRAGNQRLLTSPEDPDVKASAWAFCTTFSCNKHVEAVALTDDDFATARYVQVRWLTDVIWVSGDTFVIRQVSGKLAMVSASGSTQEIVESSQTSPLKPGELLVGNWVNFPEPDYVAVDPQNLSSHPLPIPYHDYRFLHLYQHGAQTLWGILDTTEIVSSPDGGATWRRPFSPPGGLLLDVIESGDPGRLAVVQRFGAIDSRGLLQSTDNGASWQVIHTSDLQSCVVQWTAVTPDGNLLRYVYHFDSGCAVSRGLYESDSTAWTSFHRVTVTGPGTFGGSGVLLSATLSASGEQWLYLYSQGGVVVSVDEGRTWQRVRQR
ncbi:MAG: sialidase family protein [Nocardioidaceae bacterium]